MNEHILMNNNVEDDNSVYIPTIEDQNRIFQTASIDHNIKSFQFEICAICDEKSADIRIYSHDELSNTVVLQSMKALLQSPSYINEKLMSDYDQSVFNDEFHNLLLSVHGISADSIGFCNTCHHELKKRKLPKAAIANGFWFGKDVTEFKDLNQTELMMINLAIPSVSISRISGGKNKVLRSHCYQMRNTSGNIYICYYNNRPNCCITTKRYHCNGIHSSYSCQCTYRSPESSTRKAI